MQAKDVMTRDVITVHPTTTVEAIAHLLTKHRISGVPVVDEVKRVVGIVTERDLFLKEKGIPFSAVKLPALFKQWVDPSQLAEIYRNARHYTAADVMTEPVICVDAESDIGYIAWLMSQRNLKRVPVVSGDVLVGIISRADMIKMLAREDYEICRDKSNG